MMEPRSQPDFLQQCDGFRFNLRRLPTLDQSWHTGIFERRELREEVMKLEDKSNASIPKVRLLTFRQVKDILAAEVYRPSRGTIEGPDNME